MCVCVNRDFEIDAYDLNDFDSVVMGNHRVKRPILALGQLGETTSGFGQEPHSNVFAAMTARAAQLFGPLTEGVSLDSFTPEGMAEDSFETGYLRGGGSRISAKTPSARLTVWVYMEPYGALDIGDEHRPSPRLVRLSDHGLDFVGDKIVHIKEMLIDDIAAFLADRERYWRSQAGRMTPRGDDALVLPVLGDKDGKGGGWERLDDESAVPAPKGGGGKGLPAQADDKDAVCHRTMPMVYGPNLKANREFREAVHYLAEDAVKDWPLVGPRSLLWVLMFILQQTLGGIVARQQQFMSLGKLNYGDKHMSEYAVLAKVLELAISFDQLHVTNLACFELIGRRLQMIEEKYRFRLPQFDGGVGAADPENDASLFLGLGAGSTHGRQSVMVMPLLAEHIGNELAREAAITKGKVKAHELRAQVKKMNDGKP